MEHPRAGGLGMLAAILAGTRRRLDARRHRRETEAAARESEERFALFMRHLPGLAWIKDLHGRYVFVNEAACKAFGKSAGQLYGKSDDEVFPRACAAQFKANDQRALAGEACLETLETLAHDDGIDHVSLVRKFPLFSPDGRPALVGGIAIDITDRLKAESELEEAARRKDEFLATLAHELRNPLAPLRNAMQLLRLKSPPEPELQWARDVIDRQVDHLARLIDDLLDVSRITHDNLELRRQRVALAEIIQGAVEMSRPLIEARGHRLSIELPPRAVDVHADLIRMAQVFMNLLSNAAKYMARGGDIRVCAATEGDEVVIRVRDSGAGIAPDVLPRVFDLFYQGDSSLERSHSGLGIGLSLARRLIEMHGGSIEARSEGIGRGSEFIVRLASLPDSVAVPSHRECAVDPEIAGSFARRILVVDDNRDSADSLSALLRLTGNQVLTAYDSLEALQGAEHFRPDVALLDIGMPKLNGCEAARRLRRQSWGKDLLLIAVTGWGQEEDRRRTAAAGFDAHLVKPVDYAALTRLLGRPRPVSAGEN